jgi:hypothetical protein
MFSVKVKVKVMVATADCRPIIGNLLNRIKALAAAAHYEANIKSNMHRPSRAQTHRRTRMHTNAHAVCQPRILSSRRIPIAAITTNPR